MRSTGACSAPTRPTRAGCAGIGSTGLNPQNPGTGPLIWIAREGPSIVGQYATMPVALSVKGQDVVGSWGMDVMVAPERQRQGLGELLFSTWDRHVGAALGLGLSPSSHRLFQKLRWPEVGPVPYLVKPLTRRAFRRAEWPMVLNRLVSAVTLPYVKFVARQKPLSRRSAADPALRRLVRSPVGAAGAALRRRRPPRRRLPAVEVRSPPHVRYAIAALYREGEAQGYVVYRHAREPRGKVTLLVDFLVDPDDPDGLVSLLRWVDREARAEDSDKIRGFCQHAGFRKILKSEGYAQASSSLQFVIKLNALTRRRTSTRRPTMARHAGRFGPGSMTAPPLGRAEGEGGPQPPRRHRHRERRPMVAGRARAADVRKPLRAAGAARALPPARRPADLRRDVAGGQGSAIGRRAARAARIAHREIGAHHHAWETPPSTAEDLKRHLYALDLTPERFDAQLGR